MNTSNYNSLKFWSCLNFILLLGYYFHSCTATVPGVRAENFVDGKTKDVKDWKNDENKEKNFYKAAVVEYAADDHPGEFTAQQILMHNVENYENIIAQAGAQKTDIIVFPEYGLTSLRFTRDNINNVAHNNDGQSRREKMRQIFHPYLQFIPDIGLNPCTIPDSSEVIRRISCASRQHQIYTVINLGEIVPCTFNSTHCPVDGNFNYNTALVFDRSGTIVAKYWKVNLFAEPQFDVPTEPQLSSFVTDFGVEFGVFICFDILFKVPAKELVSKGVRHFVFPTAWIDELPFLTAIQAQMFWSSSSSATILASGYHYPEYGKLGSGIFTGSGEALNYIFDPDSGTQVVYANVPMSNDREDSKLPNILTSTPVEQFKHEKEQMLKIEKGTREHEAKEKTHFYYRENLSNYTTVSIPVPEKTNSSHRERVSVCDREFCCELTYMMMVTGEERGRKSLCDSERKILQEAILHTDDNQKGENYDSSSLSSTESSIHYKLFLLNQPRKFTSPSVIRELDLQICGIVRCLNESVQSCAENYRPSNDSDETIRVPNFTFLELKASPFSIPSDGKAQKNLEKAKNEEPNQKSLSHSRPTFTTLDIYFSLIPTKLFNVTYTEDNLGLTLSTDQITNIPLQTLTLFNRIYSNSTNIF